jgi:hypothetical protein
MTSLEHVLSIIHLSNKKRFGLEIGGSVGFIVLYGIGGIVGATRIVSCLVPQEGL